MADSLIKYVRIKVVDEKNITVRCVAFERRLVVPHVLIWQHLHALRTTLCGIVEKSSDESTLGWA
jgi:hypothetical protein